MNYNKDNDKHYNSIDKLNELYGGDWYWDEEDKLYKDYMTDRRIDSLLNEVTSYNYYE